MASIFGHAVLAGALSTSLAKEIRKPKTILLGVFCSIIPDIDILAFKFHIPYGAMWGHRGLTHSLLFGILFGLVLSFGFYCKSDLYTKFRLWLYFGVCTISHGVLDALTTGGKGVAFFSPFDLGRYFLPYRVIQVSPIGAKKFFSEWGISVIRSEMLWIGIPSLLFVLLVFILRKKVV